MLPLEDAQVRFVLLNHVTVRLAAGRREELDAAGIANEQLMHLRRLSVLDLNHLAAMRGLTIGIAFDGAGLQAGLRAVALTHESRTLETYFIRNGASTRLMSELFKVRRKMTLRRRRDCDAWRRPGRVSMPDYATRERVYLAWLALPNSSRRVRFYRLHQEFQHLSIAVLEAVIRESGARR